MDHLSKMQKEWLASPPPALTREQLETMDVETLQDIRDQREKWAQRAIVRNIVRDIIEAMGTSKYEPEDPRHQVGYIDASNLLEYTWTGDRIQVWEDGSLVFEHTGANVAVCKPGAWIERLEPTHIEAVETWREARRREEEEYRQTLIEELA
jgi:hypothetical protein